MEKVFEDIATNGNRLLINQKVRCKYCNTCQVTELTKTGSVSNLRKLKGEWECTNEKECTEIAQADEIFVKFTQEEDDTGRQLGRTLYMEDAHGNFIEIDYDITKDDSYGV